MEFLTDLTGLGVGGVLAGFIFYFFRKDSQKSEKRIREICDDYKKLISSNTRALNRLSKIIGRYSGKNND